MPRGEAVVLADGDEFQMGDFLLRVSEVSDLSLRTIIASAASSRRQDGGGGR